ncbi:unnamed protein product [Discosporangium mesarthrocarpum]
MEPTSNLSESSSLGSCTSFESLSDAEIDGLQGSVTVGGSDRIAIIGSGNWGSAIARIIGRNVLEQAGFVHKVMQWVFPEKVMHEGQQVPLPDVINMVHENVKYLAGVKLPENVVAEGDLATAVEGATILIFVFPHQFLDRVLPVVSKALGLTKAADGGVLQENGKGRVRAVSLIKGVDNGPSGLTLISDKIREGLGNVVPVSVLMGANVANEVARDELCETTIGLADEDYRRCFEETGCKVSADQDATTLYRLFHRETFRVTVVRKAPATVELCGALKNVVALGAAFCDGLGYGGNTKAAIVRMGLAEMRRFAERMRYDNDFDATASSRAFLESCGVGDLMTTCYGASRNRRCAEIFAREGGKRSWEDLEEAELGGMKLQGPSTAKEAFSVIKGRKCVGMFPLMTTIYRIAFEGLPASEIINFHSSRTEAGAV